MGAKSHARSEEVKLLIDIWTEQHVNSSNYTVKEERKKERRHTIVIPYVAGVSEKLQRIFT